MNPQDKTSDPEPRPAEVRISTLNDDDASRISAVLEALGYTVVRDFGPDDDGPARLVWAVNQLARRYRLTTREQDLLTGIVSGRSKSEIAASMEVTRSTVKWHMHNVFSKTGTQTREQLLRLALQLPVGEPEHDGAVALASC